MMGSRSHLYEKYEIILRDKYGESWLDNKGEHFVVIWSSPNELVSRVFLTKPNERGDMKRAQVMELINKFDDDLKNDPICCKFKT